VNSVVRRLKTYQLVVDLVVAGLFAAIVAWPEFATGRGLPPTPSTVLRCRR
jgi:hypothetical protein